MPALNSVRKQLLLEYLLCALVKAFTNTMDTFSHKFFHITFSYRLNHDYACCTILLFNPEIYRDKTSLNSC